MRSSARRTVTLATLLCLAILATAGLVVRQSSRLVDADNVRQRPAAGTERLNTPTQLPSSPAASAQSSLANSSPAVPEAWADPAVPSGAAEARVELPVQSGAPLIDPERFFYEPDFNAVQIQAYLETQAGPLKGLRTTVGDREHSFAEILGSQSALYSINPRVVLALIEQQSGLLTNPAPSEEQQRWTLGFRGEDGKRSGWAAQLRWAIRELHRAQRDIVAAPELVFADQTRAALPAGFAVAEYAIARVIAQTTTAGELFGKLDGRDGSFVETYTRLFGDPRTPVVDWPEPASAFLSLPMEPPYDTQSFFDHDAPFLQQNGSIVTYRGDQSAEMPYDGHDGWDIGMLPPQQVLAAADGIVVFAGNSDDGCGVARAVIIDHGNGYRTLYWHLTEPTVELGQVVSRGAAIGIVGASGCVTGPHLHFQAQFLGRDIDPYGWCGSNNDPWSTHPAGQQSSWLWRDWPSPCAVPADAIVVEPGGPGFKQLGDGWTEAELGSGSTAVGVVSRPFDSSTLTAGVWQPQLPAAGRYRVLAWVPYVPNGLEDAGAARYVVGHADGSGDSAVVEINQANVANGWAELGSHPFDPARRPFVSLAANDAIAGNNVWYAQIVWVPIDGQ